MRTRAELEDLSRKELQALAKQHSIKANGSTEAIICSLLDVFGSSDAESVNEEPAPQSVVEPAEEAAADVSVAELEPEVAVPEKSDEIQHPPAEADLGPLEKGDSAFAFINEVWLAVTIKRVNKKTFRLAEDESGKEHTIPIENVQRCKPSTAASQPMECSEEEESQSVTSVPVAESAAEEHTQAIFESTQVLSLEQPAAVFGHRPTKAQMLRDSAVAGKIEAMSKTPVRPPSFASTTFKSGVTPSRRKTMNAHETATAVAKASVEEDSVADNNNNHNNNNNNNCQSIAKRDAATPSAAATTPRKPTTPAVDFSASHAKQFQNSKPISALVRKDKDIETRLDKAMDAALKPAAPATAAAAPTSAATNPFAAAITGRGNIQREKKASRDSLYGKNTFGGGSSEQKALSHIANKGHLPSSAIGAKPKPSHNSRASIMGPAKTTTAPAAAPAASAEKEFVFKALRLPKFYHKENKPAPGANSDTTATAAAADTVHIAATATASGVTSRRPMGKLTNRFSMMPELSETAAAAPVITKIKPNAVVASTNALVEKNREKRQSMQATNVKNNRASVMNQRRMVF